MKNTNLRIARELVKLAKTLVADEENIESPKVPFRDEEAKAMFVRWYTGQGNWEDAPFGDYLMKDKKLKKQLQDVLDKEVDKYLRGIKENYPIEVHAETLTNGYLTGYALLHGCNSYVGDFQVSVDFKEAFEQKEKGTPRIVQGKVHCVWNDIMDANKIYRMDEILEKRYKKMSKNVAKDYVIRIPFDFTFFWKSKEDEPWEKLGYP